MGFILGFLMGLLSAIGLLVALAYWLCHRSNNVAVSKFISGIAQALEHIAPSEPSSPDENEEEEEEGEQEASGTRNEKVRERFR